MLSHDAIWQCVSCIPEGRVATYGQIASLCGYPRHARQVGYALAALPDDTRIPWHRVINARGAVSLRRRSSADEYQRLLLEDEAVVFGANGRIDLSRFQWQPGSV